MRRMSAGFSRLFSLVYNFFVRTYQDMTVIKYKVELTQDERAELNKVARKGKSSARKVKRALALLRTDEGLSDREIAEGLAINPYTVARLRKRFVEEGLENALNERPRPGQKRKLSGKQEAHLVAIACSAPPRVDSGRGQDRTLRGMGSVECAIDGWS